MIFLTKVVQKGWVEFHNNERPAGYKSDCQLNLNTCCQVWLLGCAVLKISRFNMDVKIDGRRKDLYRPSMGQNSTFSLNNS